jgi:hypothetical protein
VSALDDRLRRAADAVHRQTELLEISAGDQPGRRAGDRTRSSRTLVAVAAGVVVVLIAAVAVGVTRSGSHGGGANSRGLTIEALYASTQRQSARMTITNTLRSSLGSGQRPGATNQLALILTGLVDFRNHAARLTTEDASGGGPPKYVGTELLVDGYVYSRITGTLVELLPPELRRTKRWGKVKQGNWTNPFSTLNPFDPLAQLRAQHVTLTDLGTTRLGNQTVRHYTGTQSAPQTPRTTGGTHEKPAAKFDIYVDSHDRLVRLISTTGQPQLVETTMQLDFADYGVRVEVTAPPADQVYVIPRVPHVYPAPDVAAHP